jgi:hypothetical protein
VVNSREFVVPGRMRAIANLRNVIHQSFTIAQDDNSFQRTINTE